MKSKVILLLATVIACLTGCKQKPEEKVEETTLVAENSGFALDLYRQLEPIPGNFFFSPYSISTCLGMTYTGATGQTATEIAKVFHWKESASELPTAFGTLQQQLRHSGADSQLQLEIANGLWAQSGHPFLTNYLETVNKEFGANIQSADLVTNAEGVRREINGWVTKRTHNTIKNLLPRGSLDDRTRIVLVNAIYFKGVWRSPFNKYTTQPDKFYPVSGGPVQVSMMHRKGSYLYAEEDGVQSLVIPYEPNGLDDSQFVMQLVMPSKKSGRATLNRLMNPVKMNTWTNKLELQEVLVRLPKFKMKTSLEMKKTLSDMGMPNAFSKSADFSGMVDDKQGIYVSQVLHEAFVTVDENGTEASAATISEGLTLGGGSGKECKEFNADHPFIFLIREFKSGTILFMGRVMNPVE